MAEQDVAQRLDEAVEALLNDRDARPPDVDPRIAALLSIASDLRDLPSPEFRERLRAELEAGSRPKTSAAAAAALPMLLREGVNTITPYLTVERAEELIDFVKEAFGAVERFRSTGSAGGIHCEVRIGDSRVMIGGGGAWRGTPTPTSIHLYVEDADAVYRRALAAGAASTEEPVDQPYGDREAGVRDLAGNDWYIATHRATGLAPAGLRSVTPFLHPRGAPALIDFLTRAFGAEEVERSVSPAGTVAHAQVRIGDSMLEMGEAHGPYQPMPTTFYLYVRDVDTLYQSAVAAGGVSVGEPADQDYGDRVAGVRDPFDNVWYLATPIRKANGKA